MSRKHLLSIAVLTTIATIILAACAPVTPPAVDESMIEELEAKAAEAESLAATAVAQAESGIEEAQKAAEHALQEAEAAKEELAAAMATEEPEPTPSSYDCSGFKLGGVVHWQGPYTIQILDGAKAAAEECGGEVQTAGPAAFDTPAQYAAFQDLVDTGVDAIITVGYPSEFWIKPIDEAVKQGVLVSTVDVASPSSLQYIYAGPKVSDLGRALANTIIDEIGEDAEGDVIAGLCLPALDVIAERYIGFKNTFADRAPNVNVSDPWDVTFDTAENFAKWQEIRSTNPDALAYVGFCEHDLNSLAKIKEDEGGDYIVASVGINPETLKAVEDGIGLVVVGQKPFMQGYVAMRGMLEGLVYDQEVPRGWADVGAEIVTIDNVAEIRAREESLTEGYEQTKEFYMPEIELIFEDFANYVQSFGDYLSQ
jgi:ABC-type sugar transport system substrate-binding protein